MLLLFLTQIKTRIYLYLNLDSETSTILIQTTKLQTMSHIIVPIITHYLNFSIIVTLYGIDQYGRVLASPIGLGA